MSTKYNKLVFNDFSKNAWLNDNFSNNLYTDLAYNVNSKSKTIKTGLGITKFKVPLTTDVSLNEEEIDYSNLSIDKINTLLYFKQYFPQADSSAHRILLHASDRKLYCYQMFSYTKRFIWIYDLTFDTPPICMTYKLDGEDTIILSSKEKMVVWTTNKAPYETTDVPIITSMCISNEVLFCTVAGEANKVWLCLMANPELIGGDTEHTQYISLDDERGYARKVLTFKENLYAFRDYGITRINYYHKRNIEIKHVYLSDSQILPNTITVCGDIVTFMTRDGVYSFDGVNVNKLNFGFENLIDKHNYNAIGGCMQDKLYLALKLNFNDDKKIMCENNTGYKNNVLVAINLQDLSYELFRGVDISSMLVLKTDLIEKVLVTLNKNNENLIGEIDNSGKVFDEVVPKYYSTNNILKDNLDKIVIRKISLIATQGVKVKLISENSSKEFVCAKNGLNQFQTMIECPNFKLEFNSLEEKCEVKHCEIEYYKK